jgi:hypothetical protein
MFEIQAWIRILVRERIDWALQILFLIGSMLFFIGLFMLCGSAVVNAVRPSTLNLTTAGSAIISTEEFGE